MKKIYAIFLLGIGLTLFSNQTTAQVTHFVQDSTKYFNQLEKFMTGAREKEGKFFMKEFKVYWYGGFFSDEFRAGVYDMSNLMLKNKKRAFPDFRDYLYTVISFVQSEYQGEKSFQIWQQTLRDMIVAKQRKTFVKYLEFSRHLLEENIMYKTTAIVWAADNSNYEFGFDSIPRIKFDKLTLKCFAKGDSSRIFETKGVYYPTTNTWIGNGGKVSWERAGESPDTVYAKIPAAKYKINFRKAEYKIDSVVFHNPNYFDIPLLGGLYEKVLAPTKMGRVTYPRFDSYTKEFIIENIVPGVDYEGGFSMYGERFIGKGVKGGPSSLTFYRNKKPFIVVYSNTFIIKTDRLVTDNGAIRIFLEEDSIYHPGLKFKYFVDEKKLTLFRDKEGLSLSPYYNTFHMIDMDFEVLTWYNGASEMEFSHLIGGTQTYALFESSNFFSERRYERLQGLADVSPLVTIRNLTIKEDTTYLTMERLASFMRMSESQVRLLLADLNMKGLVEYYYDKEEFLVKDRLFNYVYGKTGKRDYDVIQFHSEPKEGHNAVLNLDNFDLHLEGVNGILLSDSQQVYVYPSAGKIILKKNRDFLFAGKINAGRLDFYGREFSFEYDAFKLNLTNVDSLRIFAEVEGETDRMGRPKLKPVRSVIEAINGELLIDRPDNKSGYIFAPDYPIFHSHEDSYVYYDKQEVLGGVYKRENFYFHLEPFTIDSVDNFTNKGLLFEGTLQSANIFPDFDETLRLQPDHSLGFERSTPEEGYPIYQGKGQYYNGINLSNNGLRGDGKLEYLTSTTLSKDFIFFPDSMNTVTESFDIAPREEEVQFPTVIAEAVKMHWEPYEDVMYATKIDKPLIFYDGISELHGTAALRPEGLNGSGLFKFEKAEMTSNLMKYKFMEFDADTADFKLIDADSSDQAMFNTRNVNAHVDFKERFGQFRSNGGGSFIEFPQNQYISFMEEFKWFMDTESIALSAGENKAAETADTAEVRLEGAEFKSTHPEQDSLSWFSTLAHYDLKKKIIRAQGVVYISTADARVYPDSGEVTIYRKAKMKTLDNAGVVANSVTKFHNIYNATINIYGKKSYGGTGDIDYIDENDQKQKIHLNSIDVDTTGQTIASGNIESADGFTLSPHFSFRGKVLLKANLAYLTFRGGTRIGHECETLKRSWIKFESEIDPKKVLIPVDTSLEDVDGNKIIGSIILGGDSSGIYTSFLYKRQKYSHINVLPAYGYLTFDKESNEYRISNEDKLGDKSFAGNYLSLNTKSCKVYGEGKIDLGGKLGQVKLTGAGNMIHNQTDNDVIVDMMLINDFHMNENALDEMAKIINKNIALDPIKLDRRTYEMALLDLLGKETADKLISDLGLSGTFKKFPQELNKSIVLSEVKFKFNESTNSYRSFGKIGIGSIRKEQINKYVDGTVEIVKRRSGDQYNLYIELSPKTWFFFSYTRGIMYAVSSDDVFNTIIQETKPDKAKLEVKRKEEPYKFIPGTARKRSDFLKRLDYDDDE